MNKHSSCSRRAVAIVLGLLMGIVSPALATWSIAIADSESKEVAVGTVTCLTDLDLLASVPVVVVGTGAAAVQASGDFDGLRRPIIYTQLRQHTAPQDILTILESVTGHQSRQYGIADTMGRAVTFSGDSTFQWSGGVVGTIGTMTYAIQGNILAGDCVVPAIEDAVRNTPGDIPDKLMAGMEAAGLAGGDGRCSCTSSAPESCGCPPESFAKPGHIGGMIVARIGDLDDGNCNANGCADGNYFMRFNVAGQDVADPDPVLQLRQQFDAWREAHVGRPDAIHSRVRFDLTPQGPDCTPQPTMEITLLDWRGERVYAPIANVFVTHFYQSAGITVIGLPIDNGNGTYTVPLTPRQGVGTDIFSISVDDGIREVTLMPYPRLEYRAGDFNADFDVDLADYFDFADCLAGPDDPALPVACEDADFDGDADVDLADFALFAIDFTGSRIPDCNSNGIPDPCDINCEWPCADCNVAGCGQSADCNTNNIPDECELDCNGDGRPDDCDFTVTHNCCAERLDVGCSNPDIEACVCAADPYCCNVQWDRLCSAMVKEELCGFCPATDCNANNRLDVCDVAVGESPDCDGNNEPDECQNAALITDQPDDTIGCLTQSAMLSVTVDGLFPTYQWKFEGQPLSNSSSVSGVNTDTLTISNINSNRQGNYTVEATDGCLETESEPAYLQVPLIGSFSSQPQPVRSGCAGTNITFTVAITGASPAPTYRWHKNGVPLNNGGKYTGVTTPSLTISSIDFADESDVFTCVVSNACTSIESNPATIQIITPQFITQPQDACGELGETVVLTVEATSPNAIFYQWRKGTTTVAGGDTLTLENLEASDAGEYYAVAFTINPTCTGTSETATVQVGGCTTP